MGSILQWVQAREQKGLWEGILLHAPCGISLLPHSRRLQQSMRASTMDGGMLWGCPGPWDISSHPKTCAVCLCLGETLGACLILSHCPPSGSSQLTFWPACSSAEDSDHGQKQDRRVARGAPWPTVAIMVSGFITVLNGMTVGHNKSASLLSKSQTIKGLAVKVIHHHKDLRRSSLQFHSHSQYTREECQSFRGEERRGEKKGENNWKKTWRKIGQE